MDPKELVYADVEWLHLAVNRLQWRDPVNTVENFFIS